MGDNKEDNHHVRYVTEIGSSPNEERQPQIRVAIIVGMPCSSSSSAVLLLLYSSGDNDKDGGDK
eukprot:scaffold16358_cov54-Attheya_sp.AAC.5